MSYRLLVSVVCTGAVGVVMAADQMPHHKAGLWEITVALGSQKPGHEKICLDDATEKLMYKMGSGMSQKMCSQVSMHSTTSQLTVDATCKRGDSTFTSRSVTTFTGDTAYHSEITTHHENAGADRPDSKSTMDGKWVGTCPADMKPGDAVVTMEGLQQPMRMNLKDMLSN